MPLRCGIIGIAGSGKTTLFNSISPHRVASGAATKAHIGSIVVPDHRLFEINTIVKAPKVAQATVEIVDIPGLASGGTGLGSQFLADIRNVDALIHVVRCFVYPMVPSIEGSVNPVRDKETVDLELQVRDMESVEKKMQRLEKTAKSGNQDAQQGLKVMQGIKSHLESLQPARTAPVSSHDHRFLDDLFLLSGKPVLYVCNVEDSAAVSGNQFSRQFCDSFGSEPAEILILAARLEADIAELEEEKDRREFLNDAGLTEPGIDRLVRAAYHLLNLRTFFTTSPKEVRAWAITKGMTASQAAGVVHSDMERGFIRAEVIRYEDFVRFGSEHACREAGKLLVEGKNYEVQDGDLLHFRFNV